MILEVFLSSKIKHHYKRIVKYIGHLEVFKLIPISLHLQNPHLTTTLFSLELAWLVRATQCLKRAEGRMQAKQTTKFMVICFNSSSTSSPTGRVPNTSIITKKRNSGVLTHLLRALLVTCPLTVTGFDRALNKACVLRNTLWHTLKSHNLKPTLLDNRDMRPIKSSFVSQA